MHPLELDHLIPKGSHLQVEKHLPRTFHLSWASQCLPPSKESNSTPFTPGLRAQEKINSKRLSLPPSEN